MTHFLGLCNAILIGYTKTSFSTNICYFRFITNSKFPMKKLYILLAVLFTISQLFAQTNADTSKVKKIEYAFYPMAFYTPETEFAVGAGGMIYTRLGSKIGLKPSKVQLSAYYTTNHQYSFSVLPIFYFGGSANIINESKFIYSKEISKFFGIGNNTPEIENPEYEINFFRFYTEVGFETGLAQNLHVGFVYEYTLNDITDKRKNIELIDNTVSGSNGGKTSGFGLLFIVDNRDNIFYPTKNSFFKIRMIFMGTNWGSDYTYSRIVADYRKYFNLGNSHIIASQVYLESTSGDVPFFKLPALGGPNRMRGYFLGRYRDEAFLTWQIEYRKMFWWKIGAVAFFGMGDVARRLNQFDVSQFKYSYGVGLRYAFDEKENLNIRMDIGFGKNTSGVYFSLEEAF